MSKTTRGKDDAIESFVERVNISISDRGEPPLANSEDPLLDRERIHLDEDE